MLGNVRVEAGIVVGNRSTGVGCIRGELEATRKWPVSAGSEETGVSVGERARFGGRSIKSPLTILRCASAPARVIRRRRRRSSRKYFEAKLFWNLPVEKIQRLTFFFTKKVSNR